MQAIIKPNQMTLWNELPVIPAAINSRLTFVESRNADGEVTAHAFRLLPVNAGEGKDSLAKRTGKKGDALAVEAAKASLEVKQYLIDLATRAGSCEEIGGVGMRMSKSGRMTLTFKRLKSQTMFLTDEEMAAQLGCSVAEVAALRKNKPAAPAPALPAPKPGKGKKLKPAPQNGQPELVPAK